MRELDPDNNMLDRLIIILLAFIGIPGMVALVMWVLWSAAQGMHP